jgi:adenosine kinase
MTFPDKFENHILPDKVHMLNVAFNVDRLDVDLGGTAGNIAYNLTLLDEKPTIHAVIGNDSELYFKKLDELGLSRESIKVLGDAKTAQAFVTTDLADNQITAFHGGAMYSAHEHPLAFKDEALVIVAPNGIEAIVEHARYCQHKKIPFLFDPGQAFNALTADQLVKSVHESLALTVNDYEWQMWQEKTSLSEMQTLGLTKAIIITLGEKGCRVITAKEEFELPAVPDLQVVDPTGSGDAFRAGLLYGLSRGWDLKKSAVHATTLASFCVETQGTQNHSFTMDEFENRLMQFN